MKNKPILLLLAVASVLLTTLAYLIDTDPLYEDFKYNVIEFLAISIILFIFFAFIFFISKFISGLYKRG